MEGLKIGVALLTVGLVLVAVNLLYPYLVPLDVWDAPYLCADGSAAWSPVQCEGRGGVSRDLWREAEQSVTMFRAKYLLSKPTFIAGLGLTTVGAFLTLGKRR